MNIPNCEPSLAVPRSVRIYEDMTSALRCIPRFVLSLLSVSLLSVGALTAAAQVASPESPLSGTFVLAEERAPALQRVHRAIDVAVEDMSFMIRDIARNRLRDRNPVYREVEVAITGDRVRLRYDDARYEAPIGSWTPVTSQGDALRLLVQRSDGRLYATFRGDDGEKRFVHTMSEDGRYMWLDVTVSSSRLPAPVSYRLTMRRAS